MSLFRKKKKKKETPGAFANALAKTLATTSKQLVWVYAINSVLWIWCSYLLAFMNKGQIAETLSSTVCTIVIGQLAFYLVTSTIENVFKYNDIFGPRMKYDPTPEIMRSVYTEETDHVEHPIAQPSPVEPPIPPEPPAAPTGVADTGTVDDIANRVAELAKSRDANLANCDSNCAEGGDEDVTPVG